MNLLFAPLVVEAFICIPAVIRDFEDFGTGD
jgi:hypothetical protein